jgi:hypothetical protein
MRLDDGASYELPESRGEDDAKVGDADAIRRTDPARGAELLFAWASDQNLLIEACCDATAADHLFEVAEAALERTRERAPARCTAAESDLDQESLATNLSNKTSRVFDRDGCPILGDIAWMKTYPGDDHCWPDVVVFTMGTPLGSRISRVGTSRLRARPGRNGGRRRRLARSGRTAADHCDRHRVFA